MIDPGSRGLCKEPVDNVRNEGLISKAPFQYSSSKNFASLAAIYNIGSASPAALLMNFSTTFGWLSWGKWPVATSIVSLIRA